MPDTGFENLLVVAVVALAAPLLVAWLPSPAPVLRVPAVIGLAFLLFLVGLELDVRGLRGRVLRLAVVGDLVSLGLGTGAGLAFSAAGWVDSPLLVAVALSATSLGLVVPVLRDAGQVDRAAGRLTVAAATLADVAAILLLTLLFSESSSSGGPPSAAGSAPERPRRQPALAEPAG